MGFSLQDRVVVLTGAASGIGASLATVLAEAGARVALIDRDDSRLAGVAEALRSQGRCVEAYLCDVTDRSSIEALPGRIAHDLGEASVLINNAGIGLAGRFEQVTEQQFDRVMGTNFSATVAMTRLFLPQLRANKPSQIVNLSSIFGLVGAPGQAAYCASKFAVRGFSEALRIELDGSDVGVTVIHPGGVRTDIARNSEVGPGVSPESRPSMQATADRFLRMSPDTAARRILKAIVRREKRVLVGADARLLSGIQRLFPGSYGRVFPKP